MIGGLTACNTTKQVGESKKDFSGFLGDYSMLEKGPKGMANYVYFDHEADWSKYTKVYIENIDLWKSKDKDSPVGSLSPENQQMLVNFFHTALDNALKKDFEIVDKPGPDTLVIHGGDHRRRKILAGAQFGLHGLSCRLACQHGQTVDHRHRRLCGQGAD